MMLYVVTFKQKRKLISVWNRFTELRALFQIAALNLLFIFTILIAH